GSRPSPPAIAPAEAGHRPRTPAVRLDLCPTASYSRGSMHPHRAAVAALAAFAVAGALAGGACNGGGGGSSGDGGGTGGEGGCPTAPVPLFTITIHAPSGPLPPNTTLNVTWSAGEEPEFKLSDATTWKTLDDDANVVCEV